MLSTGEKAPEFSLPGDDMKPVALTDFRDRNVVLYFYPKDDTPGCTIEATGFSELEPEFSAANTVVIGVSRDTCFSHQAFRDKYGLSIQLLADVEGEVSNSYGVWQEKEKNGKKQMGIVRSTFVIDGDGLIRYAEYGVTVKDHVDKVLEFVKTLQPQDVY